MSEFLDKLDEEFSKKEPKDYYLDEIFRYTNSNDEIYKIIRKYDISASRFNNFKLNDHELELVVCECGKEHHLMVQIFLNYLLAFTRFRNQSKLISLCEKLIRLYYSIPSEDDGLIHNSCIDVISWCLYKYPDKKKELSEYLLKEINSSVDSKKNMCLFESAIRNENLKILFTDNDLNEIHKTNFSSFDLPQYVNLNLSIFQDFIQFLEERKNKPLKKEYEEKYIDFVVKNLPNFETKEKGILLQNILDLMRTKKYPLNEIWIVENDLKKVNEELQKDFKSIDLPLDKKTKELMEEGVEWSKRDFEVCSNEGKIMLLLCNLYPFNKTQLKTQIDESHKSIWHSICETLYVNHDGRIVNYKKLDPTQMFSLEARQNIMLSIKLTFLFLIDIFYQNFQLDNLAKEYLHHIINDNLMIDKAHTKRLCTLFERFFNKDFEDSTFNIISTFEGDLRYYFESVNLTVIKMNGDRIGLSDIFNYHEQNIYRDELYKVIDEDFYFTLTWLLTDQYGEDLRNRIAHT